MPSPPPTSRCAGGCPVLELAREREHAVDRVEEGLHGRDLRADVRGDPDHVERVVLGGQRIEPPRLLDGDAELVLAQAGRDVRVRPRIDVRVHPERDRRADAHAASHDRDPGELARALDVEHAHARLERERDLVVALADAAEDDLARIAPRLHDAVELARDLISGRAEQGPRQDRGAQFAFTA
jgi:hypothetical protein